LLKCVPVPAGFGADAGQSGLARPLLQRGKSRHLPTLAGERVAQGGFDFRLAQRARHANGAGYVEWEADKRLIIGG
jgi:hypothetical protein